MQTFKLILGGMLIVTGIMVAIGILPQMLEQQKERRAELKSQLLKYQELGTPN